MRRVVILGATGMLGSTLVEYFSRTKTCELVATGRNAAELKSLERIYPNILWKFLDAEISTAADVRDVAVGAAWVINAIGLIKQRIVDTDDAGVEKAIRINGLFSHVLAHAAESSEFKIIQIATDCVYSGASGRYSETAVHDCHDVYGKSKSLGELRTERMRILRCSIVGREPKSNLSLLNWFLNHEQNSTVNGYVNHVWNGLTALHFARICEAVITHDLDTPHLQHVVPDGEITKEGLLRLFAQAYGRSDITINRISAQEAINRTLATENPASNRALWAAAGYPRAPTISEMVMELAEYQRSRDDQKSKPAALLVKR
ncbi:MAG TPA: sugar nucleotide-binding protein [Xanthobacteraceae bacterium]|nr:sugar nucleotide-binding protein [Xanthobacteraceae bacterium]